jgi:hypothetical protein
MVLKRVDFSSITSEDLEELGAKRKLLPLVDSGLQAQPPSQKLD